MILLLCEFVAIDPRYLLSAAESDDADHAKRSAIPNQLVADFDDWILIREDLMGDIHFPLSVEDLP
jgi:hypothetical protein